MNNRLNRERNFADRKTMALGLVFVLLTVLPALASPAQLADFSGIVYAPENGKRWNQLAAEQLQKCIKTMTGHEIPIVQTVGSNEQCVYIGPPAVAATLISQADVDNLGIDGYIAVLKGNRAGICGDRIGAGVLHGVYAFLGQFGLKIYASDCEVFPENPTADEFRISAVPDADLRHAYKIFGDRRDLRGMNLVKLGFSANLTILEDGKPASKISMIPKWLGHPSRRMFSKQTLEAHPEYCARDPQGHVKKKGYGHVCLSHPIVKKTFYEKLKKVIADNPEGVFFQTEWGDDYGWCQCEKCLKLDPQPWTLMPDGYTPVGMTDRWVPFISDIADMIAKDFPNRKIELFTFGYQSTQAPPVRVKRIAPNLSVYLCPYPVNHGNCHGHDFNCPANAGFLADFRKWRSEFPNQKLGLFDYPLSYSSPWSTFFFVDSMIDRTRFILNNGGSGILYCGRTYHFTDLWIYLSGKILWDASLTDDQLDALEKDFLNYYYGPAASEMGEVLALMRQRSAVVCQGIYTYGGMVTPKYATKMYEIFDRAEARVKDNPTLQFRVVREKITAALFSDLDQFITSDRATRLKLLKDFVRICRLWKRFNTEIDPDNGRRIRPKGDFLAGRRAGDMCLWVNDKFGLALPPERSKGNWYEAPELDALDKCTTHADFAKLAKRLEEQSRTPVKQTVTADAIEFDAGNFQIDGACTASKASVPTAANPHAKGLIAVIYGKETMQARFEYDSDKPFKNGTLTLVALDHDKTYYTPTVIRVLINDKEIFNGPNKADKKLFTELTFPIPDGLIHKGLNQLRIEDIDEPQPHGKWFMLHKVIIRPSNYRWSEMKTIHYGGKDTIKGWSLPGFHSSVLSPDKKTKSPTGGVPLKITIVEKKGPVKTKGPASIQVWPQMPQKQFKLNHRYKATFWAKSSVPVKVNAYYMGCGPLYHFMGKGSEKLMNLDSKWQRVSVEFTLTHESASYRTPVFYLAQLKPGTILWISPIQIMEQTRQ